MEEYRKIKFRGISVKTDDWVYGYYSVLDSIHYIGYGGKTSVYPETIGEYIGLEDKHKEELYEGMDIRSDQHTPEIMKIVFREGGFCVIDIYNLDFMSIDINHFYPSTGCCIEIVK